jgi:protein-S-isoprenylcysteine O-methyltransferase Ste14
VAAFFLMFAHQAPRQWLRLPLYPASRFTDGLAIAVTVAGIGFAIRARAYLGTNWSSAVTVKVGHQLVRSGPYRWVRHPIYTGLILGLAGTAIARAEVRASYR